MAGFSSLGTSRIPALAAVSAPFFPRYLMRNASSAAWSAMPGTSASASALDLVELFFHFG